MSTDKPVAPLVCPKGCRGKWQAVGFAGEIVVYCPKCCAVIDRRRTRAGAIAATTATSAEVEQVVAAEVQKAKAEVEADRQFTAEYNADPVAWLKNMRAAAEAK